MVKQLYVNLPVKDLNKAVGFFTKLGFKFNKEYTDENAACLIIGEDIYAMLVVEKFFLGFITKTIADALRSTEVLLALEMENKEEVDNLCSLAVQAGGKQLREPTEDETMYSRSFEDLDGHIWETFVMK